jgi:hypothetical protein
LMATSSLLILHSITSLASFLLSAIGLHFSTPKAFKARIVSL